MIMPLATTFSDPVHDLRYRIADLLARIETEEHGLDAGVATQALLETAYGAALTFCSSPDRARRHVDTAVERIHSGASRPSGFVRAGHSEPPTPARGERGSSSHASPPAGQFVMAVVVAVLSWATIAFLARRGPISPWNLLGPLFCTALALVSAYRHLVAGRFMRPWSLFTRPRHVRAL
jgi:hypothetical protein